MAVQGVVHTMAHIPHNVHPSIPSKHLPHMAEFLPECQIYAKLLQITLNYALLPLLDIPAESLPHMAAFLLECQDYGRLLRITDIRLKVAKPF